MLFLVTIVFIAPKTSYKRFITLKLYKRPLINNEQQ